MPPEKGPSSIRIIKRGIDFGNHNAILSISIKGDRSLINIQFNGHGKNGHVDLYPDKMCIPFTGTIAIPRAEMYLESEWTTGGSGTIFIDNDGNVRVEIIFEDTEITKISGDVVEIACKHGEAKNSVQDKISVDFIDTELIDIIGFICQVYNCSLSYDPSSKKLSKTVSLNMRSVTLMDIMHELGRQLSFSATFAGNGSVELAL